MMLIQMIIWEKSVIQCPLKTKFEAETLNVYDFGAVGDGIHDDTSCIQAAIMSAGCDSRVLIPKGNFLIHGIFVKSNLSL